MAKEDRFYAFIIAHTSRFQSPSPTYQSRKTVCNDPLRRSAGAGRRTVYGLYGLTQHASHLRIEFENQRLRAENERQRQELEKLNNRVEKVEDTSRKLAEKSGVVEQPNPPGTGGPALPLDEMGLATLTAKMGRLEEDLRAYGAILRQRGYTPTVWPVEGTLEGGFGGRRNPFGGSATSFTQARTLKRPGAPRWLQAPVGKSPLLAGRMATDSSLSSIMAVV